ncbi:STBPA-like protein [Mya arenaria]|uniref:STBPA-like protein n=1 Tax=Mya arenaria TaxID=6604 RepID=A0ABY7DHA8_MYAAR|nr:STBPA-like protein [Mya arenaria]
MADSVKSNIALSLSYIRDPKAKVRELCTYAGQVEVEPSVPARRYLRSGLEMLRMAKVYKDEGEYESAFILYMKFITLFVEKLPRHPGYKEAPPKDVANIKQRREAEELAREQERLRQEEEARRREEEERSKKLREQSEELWLREQEEKFRQLQEREKEKQSDKDRADPNILLVDVPCPNRPSSGLNNERGSMPSGSLSFIPNDLRQGQRPKLEKNLSLDYTSNIPDRELKRTLTIRVSGTNKYGLKNVVIPRDIVVKFMSIAEQNTRRNIETCGILSGKMTHPTQTAFLSSVDLHTHYPYQQLMPEAVAIVVSPKFNES